MKKFVLVILIFACSQKETPQQKAEAAVKKYVRKNAHKPSSYEPISFGKLDSIYTTEGTNYWELDVIRKNLVAQYNDARKKGMTTVADSLRAELLRINLEMESGKIFTGLKIYHISQGKNELGETVMNRGSFYLDSNFLVKEFIMTEDSLLMEGQ